MQLLQCNWRPWRTVHSIKACVIQVTVPGNLLVAGYDYQLWERICCALLTSSCPPRVSVIWEHSTAIIATVAWWIVKDCMNFQKQQQTSSIYISDKSVKVGSHCPRCYSRCFIVRSLTMGVKHVKGHRSSVQIVSFLVPNDSRFSQEKSVKIVWKSELVELWP